MTETTTAPTQEASPSTTTAAPPAASSYTLDESGEVVTWPPAHCIYVEQSGPIVTSARTCWTTLHSHIPTLRHHTTITKYTAMYRLDEQQPGHGLFRAGVLVEGEPKEGEVPAGLESGMYGGGRYARFVMVGSYMHLGEASGRVYRLVGERGLAWQRDEMSVEHYLKDPSVTPANELVTEILVPVA